MKSESLKVSIEMAAGKMAQGKVIIFNEGNAPTRVWRTGSSWADDALFFEVKRDGRTEAIKRKAQTYTRNVPATAALASGGTYEIGFDLEDSRWEPAASVKEVGMPNTQLIAVYRVQPSAESKMQGAWTGEIKSEAVDVK